VAVTAARVAAGVEVLDGWLGHAHNSIEQRFDKARVAATCGRWRAPARRTLDYERALMSAIDVHQLADRGCVARSDGGDRKAGAAEVVQGEGTTS